ncbi:SH3 domain-containing protein [Pendulispora rubella]|uniref:SH3 domain-containing protein n=1 Tax=Pendulispora rubella TaxID=2741070 RepID=A0ABZ2KW31_9BACT
MESNKRQGPPYSVDIPKGKADEPSWLRVAAIAIVGFVVGVAWPKVAGVRIGPAAPPEAIAAHAKEQKEQQAAAEASAAAANAPTPTGNVPSVSAIAPSSAGAPAVQPANAPDVLVKGGILLACRTSGGETIKGMACGPIAFDAIAQPRMKKLSQCAAAQGAEGKFGVIFNLDFNSNRTGFTLGKSSTVKDPDGMLGCLRQSFESVSLSALAHEHPTYSLLYNANFVSKASAYPASSPSARGNTPAAPAEPAGTATQIMWEVAIVRDKPRTGLVVARLPRGTNVHLGASQDGGWYQVKYGENFASEGWLYRAAIGK